ncbi:MAG: amylo-alpha-1,6-glucosidase [Bacteroidales bacterium]|jgi:predicted glycogen debranching enzyme|nr:amylo-alpha-1,6-glucosidase [Bacteroidales bacterium]MCI1784579.1 amylo-alpha-1,6-glucosidase [Bacteroidales bacterium]
MAFLKFNKSELVNLSYSLKREIICANKTGAYCNTSIVTCNTRRYHGLLAVPIDKFGGRKYLLLSSLDETIITNGKQFNLGIHCYGDVYEPRGHKYIVDFDADPVPHITYKVGEIVFTKSILLQPDRDQVMIKFELLQSPSKIVLQLKPFLAFRNIHALTMRNMEARTGFAPVRNGVSFNMYDGFPDLNLQLSSSRSSFRSMPYWYNGITYSDESRRGFACCEDLFVPGYFETELGKGESLVFSASVDEIDPLRLKRCYNDKLRKISGISSFHDQLVHCADLLKCDRNGHKMITAGFSWLYTGLLRETILALPGLTLYTDGNTGEFEEILDNLIHDEQERLFHRTTQVEAPLSMTRALQQYIGFCGNAKYVWKKYGGTLKGIIESYAPGRRKEVAMQPNGLLWAQMDGVALSWMNAYVNGRPVTERAGYQVETNALWYNALCFALDMESRYGEKNSRFIPRWSPVRDLVKANYQTMFWNPQWGYLADYVDNNGMNPDIRPNQLCPVAMPYSPIDDEIADSVMKVVSNDLVTRRGIRTLSPRDSKYKGVYEGAQTERDLAYHQGSTRPSLLGDYVAICFKMQGPSFSKKAEWLTEGFYDDLNKHGVGAFSEIYDGDPPHEPHGAISSALSTAALLTVDYIMDKNKEE